MSENPSRFPTRIVLPAAALIFVVIAVIQLPVKESLNTFNQQVAEWGVPGMILFVGVYALSAVLFIPASVLTLGAGFAFGLGPGMILVSIASTLGAALSFLVSRYVARDKVKAKFGHKENFIAVDKAVSSQGWKIVTLLRLSPVFPYNALNYILGLTGIRFFHYVFASWAGMLPGTLLYVYLGSIGKQSLESASGVRETSLLEWTFRLIGLLATLGVTFYVTRIASKAINSSSPVETSV